MIEIEKEAIIIGSTDVGEKDKMVRAFCSDGYFSFYAKGVASIKSKNSSALSIFSKSKLTLLVRPNGTFLLKTALLLDQFFSIESYEQMSICSLMEELSKLFINETTEPSLYSLFCKCLVEVKKEPIKAGLNYLYLLLKSEGILPPEFVQIVKSKESSTKIEQITYLNRLIDYVENTQNILLRSKDLIKLI